MIFIRKFFSISFLLVAIILFTTQTVQALDVQWNGNGTDNGYCSKLEENYDLPPNTQKWHFILTNPDANESTLTANFDPDGTKTQTTTKQGNISFYITTSIGAKLLAASATNGKNNSQLTVSTCEYNPIKPLEISKTVETGFTRNWTWNIDKSSDQINLGELLTGQIYPVKYTITLTPEYYDSNWQVTGTITIKNPEGNPAATITSITDTLDVSGNVTVNCPDGEDWILNAGESLECTYSKSVELTSDTKNTVTVATSGNVPGGSYQKDFTWVTEPTTEVDECINVADDQYKGELGAVCADSESKSFEYEMTFSNNMDTDIVWECNQTKFTNVASFVTNDTETTGNDDITITGHVVCTSYCSYSQGYWFAKPNNPWPSSVLNITQPEGIEIWKSSNKGGISGIKKAFLQYAAIKLSFDRFGWHTYPTEIQPYMEYIESRLNGLNKTDIINAKVKDPILMNAASNLGDWINDHHCLDE